MIGVMLYGLGLIAAGCYVLATGARERGYRAGWDRCEEHNERCERWNREELREQRLAKLEAQAVADLTGQRVTIREAEAIARGEAAAPEGTSFVRAIRFEVPLSALQQAEVDLANDDDDDADELDDDDGQDDDLDH